LPTAQLRLATAQSSSTMYVMYLRCPIDYLNEPIMIKLCKLIYYVYVNLVISIPFPRSKYTIALIIAVF
jgi:hypothetical protein